ncbi:sulfurtransferase complex subunit TusB [Shewanella atlantica]|uniref:Sulfurtransferase complex subunit TusB n=1 Tax=Shewanella atlantica TaxID=271099 RepID=A0A3S0IJ05_9GAMM|nr:sulfurtransferase complex subunit TusB [Shewanella atlantica]RTR33604.1 sulfurtransferase complex subunit TusB [Shewanella atlantica]
MNLHHIQTSAKQDNALACCLKYMGKQDAILLSGNGVNSLLLPEWQERLADIRVMALKGDVEARGLSQRLGHYTVIDYDTFVQESLKHDKVITW